MQYLHNDLGLRSAGDLVEVTLDRAANVKLMDGSNFSSYRSGRKHQYYGGQATQSPVRLSVPHSGHWHLAIDLGGYGGSVRAGVRVLG
jgi:hypothetical protein